jgi:glycerol-3-phosphate acyltransferase PlsY
MVPTLIIVASSYLIGSIPFGFILVRIFHGRDVRESGSGNIGATNVARSSPVLGIFTLLLDAGKGSAAVIAAVFISHLFELNNPATESEIFIRAALAAFFAVLGHMFPIWLKFKGGKGVATGFGSFALIAPKAALVMVVVFAATLLAFRLVSVGSIFSVALFPLPVWLLHEYHEEPFVLALVSAASILIALKHHENIRRLMLGTEPRFQLRRG